MTYMYEQLTQIILVGGSRNYRQGVGVQDILTQQLTFLVQLFYRGVQFQGKQYFSKFQGGGGYLYSG